MSAEEPLAGGIANLGNVVRVGDTVRRPASAFTEPAFVEMLARQGGEGRAERRRRWLDDNIDALRAALE